MGDGRLEPSDGGDQAPRGGLTLPGLPYPPRVCHVEAPAWHEHRVVEAEARETEFGDVLDQVVALHAPQGDAA